MRRFLAGFLVLAGALCGCQSSGVDTNSDKAPETRSGGRAALMGQPVTIDGNGDGAKLRVTLVRVKRTVTSTDKFSTVSAGNRLLGVQFRLFNTGDVAYNGSPRIGALVVDGQGQQFEPATHVTDIKAGAVFPASITIAPGDKALGFLVFSVPEKAKIKQVQFTQDNGFGQTAQWRVK